tara:strand:- start:186 stop:1166 length:981 start_codon:yes stop_codon:yes gene_type:complete
MAYIGREPQIGNFQVCDAISVVNGQAAYTMQVSSTNVSPETANHMLVSLNGILQKPGSSFTVAGSTITFASNLATGDVIDFIIILGNVLDLGTPSDNTVATAKIADDAVTAAKINNDIISGTTALASEPADTDEFLVSDAGTLKRIDYSLIKGSGTHVLLSTSTISSGVSELDVTSNIDSTYKSYLISVINLHPSADGATLYMHFHSSSGSPDTSSEYRYGAGGLNDNAVEKRGNQNPGNYQKVGSISVGGASDEGWNAHIYLFDPASSTFKTQWMADSVAIANDNSVARAYAGGTYTATPVVTGFRLYMNTGNIDSAVVKLYGIT